MTTAASPALTSGDVPAAEWRLNVQNDFHRIDDAVGSHDRALAQTVATLERINSRLDEHDRRLGSLESQPEHRRNAIDTYGGCLGQVAAIVISCVSGLGTLIAVGVSIVAIIHH
jgi:ferric-dicitrate binding protein FerR (iron transport regulator)